MKKVLLIADDEESVREAIACLVGAMYRSRVESGELEIQTVGDGVEAIALASRTAPSLILMDVNMPLIDGIEAFYKIKDNNGNVPVNTFLLTAYSTDGTVRERVEQAMTDGLLGCLSKPIGAVDLARIIDEYAFGSGPSGAGSANGA
ncbi:MAG: response regulator [Acidobacteria bacterium]|nr:response regulator [Acidobacteriota bacterium]